MATAVVLVENPTWFQKETSVLRGDYVMIYRFGFNANTKCSLADGAKLRPWDALEGSLNGWYECRLVQPEDRNGKGRIMKYIKDNTTLETAFGLTLLLTLGAFAFGKK